MFVKDESGLIFATHIIIVYVTAAGSLSPETSAIPVNGPGGVHKGKLRQLLNVNRILVSLMGGHDLPHWKVVGLALAYFLILWLAIRYCGCTYIEAGTSQQHDSRKCYQ